MAINAVSLGRAYTHDEELPKLLRALEGYVSGVYDDTQGFATIGIGFNIRSNADALRLMLDYLGVFAADDANYVNVTRTSGQIRMRHEQIVADFAKTIAKHPLIPHRLGNQAPGSTPAEQALQASLDQLLTTYQIDHDFEFDTETDAKLEKSRLIKGFTIGPYTSQSFELRLDNVLNSVGVQIAHDTREYKALMSLYYSSPTRVDNADMRTALTTGRAETWIQIRYFSVGAKAANGIAKRRFVEAEVFGLYDSVTTNEVEAREVYTAYSQHRRSILEYESRFGIPPDNSAAQANMIGTANADPFIAAVITTRSLYESLRPARDVLIPWLNGRLPQGIAALTSSDWNPAAIFFAGEPEFGQTFDGRLDDGKGNGMEKSLAIGSNQRGDTLFGGAGNDFLMAAPDTRLNSTSKCTR